MRCIARAGRAGNRGLRHVAGVGGGVGAVACSDMSARWPAEKCEIQAHTFKPLQRCVGSAIGVRLVIAWDQDRIGSQPLNTVVLKIVRIPRRGAGTRLSNPKTTARSLGTRRHSRDVEDLVVEPGCHRAPCGIP